MKLLSFFVLISAMGITFVTTAPASTKEEPPQVPMIEDCAFVDAYYATCWWKRRPDDHETIYRLGHISSSYHPDENDEKYCDYVHSRVTDDGIQIEECGFKKANLFQRFTFWVEVVTRVQENYFPTGSRSQEVSFTASASTVKLTVPPHSLNIEKDGQLLTWSEPEKDDSLLMYVTAERKLFYKVESRIHSVTKDDKWKEWYSGYESESRLSELVPGVSYDLRVFASLDYGFPISEEMNEEDEEREWSEPSAVLVYAVPAPPETIRGKVKIAAILTPIVVVILALVTLGGYLMYWKGHCCFEVKFIKPNAFIDLDAKPEEIVTSESALMNDSSNRTEERIYPVTMNDEFDWIVKDLRHKKGSAYTITISNEIAEDDLKRHILRSFKQENIRSSFQDEICSNSTDCADNDVMRMEMLSKQKQRFRSKSSLDEESIQYMKLVENDGGIPTYLLADSEERTESRGSQESIDTEYVMEYTAVDPTATPSGTYQPEKTPQTEFDDTKSSQITETVDKSMLEFSYGAIPDYVMQASVSYEDFARTMTSFLHTLTHTEHRSENDDGMTEQQHRTADISPNSTLRSHLTNHDMKITHDADHCDVTLPLYGSGDEYATHMSPKTEKDGSTFKPDEISTNKSKAMLSRSGSGSLPSIDSGYSAETPEVS